MFRAEGGLYRRQDWLLLGVTLALCGLGVAFIYSASYRGAGMPVQGLWSKQLLWVGVGLIVYLVVIQLDPHRLIRAAPFWYGVGIVLLLLVATMGTELKGGKRWLDLGVLLLQPSELVKLTNLLLLAYLLGEVDSRPPDLRRVIFCLLLVGAPLVMVMVQPDLGTAMVFLPTAVGVLFLAGMRWRHLFGLAAVALIVLLPVIVQLIHYDRVFYPILKANPAAEPPGWYLLRPYQCNRVLVFLDPSFETWGAGWNLLQCKIAVGSGGWAGKGFLRGEQNLLGFLPRPVAPTDFIFSVLAEELGFRGVAALLGLYTVLLTRTIWIAFRCRADVAGGLLAGGIAIMFFCHVFVNVGMTIGLLPITGLPLPLLSYGGSFMLSTMLAIGLVQAVYVRRRP